jgi:MoxR-like ATPase
MDNIKDVENLVELKDKFDKEISKIIIGQDKIINQIFIALLSNGHIILEGVPGLAKTLLINSISKALDLNFSRIQFTPDLMPTDITGTEIIQQNKTTGEREFKFYKGPIFSNIILADEINRTPPKTQAALLQAMQEKEITIGNETYHLEKPFFVFATQNPIEQEGTYPLPEAQLDRFMFNLIIEYPNNEEEILIVKNMNDILNHNINPIIKLEDLIKFQNLLINMPVADNVIEYAVKFVRMTRLNNDSSSITKKWLNWGAGPRASAILISAAKACAIINGRFTPEINDVKLMIKPVLRHRIIPNFNAEAEGLTRDNILDEILISIQ